MKQVRIKLIRGDKEGSILIVGLTVVTFLLFLVVPLLFQKAPENTVTDRTSNYLAALSLAEAGIERAIWEMNHGDISVWKGDSNLRRLTISSTQAPEGNVIGDIEIRIEEPDGENPVVKSTGRVVYNGPLAGDRTARIVLERSSRVVLERSGYSWVCSFPERKNPAASTEASII